MLLPIDQTEIPQERIDEAIEYIKDRLRKTGRSISSLSGAMGRGFSAPTLTQLLQGNYKGDVVTKLRFLLEFLDHEEQKEQVVKPTHTVHTGVVRNMMNAIKRAHASTNIIAIIGPAGCSKTTTLQAAAREILRSIYIRVRQSTRNDRGIIALIGEHVGIPKCYSSRRLQSALINDLRGSGRLLLIDEAHRLDSSALDALRDLHDECEVAIVLAGTDDLDRNINDTGRGGQLYSRIDMIYDVGNELRGVGTPGSRPVPLFTVEEVLEICRADTLRFTGDGAQMLYELANTPGLGGIRACERIVSLIAANPKYQKEKAISRAVVLAALKRIKGAAHQRFMEQSSDRAGQDLAKAAG